MCGGVLLLPPVDIETAAFDFSKTTVLGRNKSCWTAAFFLLPSCGISNLNSPIDIVLSPHGFHLLAEPPLTSAKRIAHASRGQVSPHDLQLCDMDICRRIATYSTLFRLSEHFYPCQSDGRSVHMWQRAPWGFLLQRIRFHKLGNRLKTVLSKCCSFRRNKQLAHIHPLKSKQRLLFINAARIAGQTAA